jgi:hypothetical protein
MHTASDSVMIISSSDTSDTSTDNALTLATVTVDMLARISCWLLYCCSTVILLQFNVYC